MRTSLKTNCEYCEHPQAKPETWETVYITGGVTSINCPACSIEGRGTLGCPIHVHYCKVHQAAPNMLANLKDIDLRVTQARIASQIGKKSKQRQVDFLLGELERLQEVARKAIVEAEGIVVPS